jgi:hypothetical protein
MSLLYSDLPVYVSAPNDDSPGETNRYVAATQANVSFSVNNVGKRLLGSNVDATDQFRFGEGGVTANISFSTILDPAFNGGLEFANADHVDDFFAIKIGINTYKKCYLNDFSVSVAPYAPVTLNANFTSLQPVSGARILKDSNPYGGNTIPFDPDDIIYGHTCSVSNMTDVVGNVQSQINYKKTFSRTPVYNIGSTNATSMLLDSVESEMSITSTGLENLISISGDKLASDVVVELDNVDGDSVVQFRNLTMAAGARVLAEGYDINGGDTLSTTATIKQIDL